MLILFIIAFFVGIIGICLGVNAKYGSIRDKFAIVCMFISYVMMFCYLFSFDDNTSKPTALDVYKGKTTLQITYKDSIPVDSVVVFKK